MLSLQKLKIFVAVVQRGSFNRAARDLLMSQSAVSQHMQDLEASLGADLFIRSPKGVQPTDAGNILFGYAQRILRLITEVEGEIMQVGQVRNRQLTIGTTPGVSVYILPQWLRQFQNSYANISVSLNAVLTAQVVEGTLQHQYNLGFLEGALDELDRADLGHIDLWDIEYKVMVGANHPWRTLESIPLTALATQPFVNRQPTSRTRRWLEGTLAQRGITLNNTAELDSPGTIKYALLSGMGVAILPQYAVTRELERDEIHALTLDDLSLNRPFKLVWDRRKPFDPLQRAFLNLIRQQVPQVGALL